MTRTVFVDSSRVHLLAGDLDRISQGNGPSTRDLAAAPLLTNWRLHWEPMPVLVGQVSGHPILPDGYITTSLLFAADFPNGNWCRTLNRWYRLDAKGAPKMADHRHCGGEPAG